MRMGSHRFLDWQASGEALPPRRPGPAIWRDSHALQGHAAPAAWGDGCGSIAHHSERSLSKIERLRRAPRTKSGHASVMSLRPTRWLRAPLPPGLVAAPCIGRISRVRAPTSRPRRSSRRTTVRVRKCSSHSRVVCGASLLLLVLVDSLQPAPILSGFILRLTLP